MLLKFATKAAKAAHRITDMEINQLRQLGMSDEDLVDIVGTIALAAANYMVIDILDLPIPPGVPEIVLEEMQH